MLGDALRAAQPSAPQRTSEHTDGLSREIDERGSNLSMGQRALVSLARALLKHALIYVLDEATASVDKEADAHVQRTLSTTLGAATVLTIAHRLETLMGGDAIVVMDKGLVLERGAPEELKNRDGGAFAAMWRAAQDAETG